MRYHFKTRPYSHQVAAINHSLDGFRKTNSHALLMEPRTGKTKIGIDLAGVVTCASVADGLAHALMMRTRRDGGAGPPPPPALPGIPSKS